MKVHPNILAELQVIDPRFAMTYLRTQKLSFNLNLDMFLVFTNWDNRQGKNLWYTGTAPWVGATVHFDKAFKLTIKHTQKYEK